MGDFVSTPKEKDLPTPEFKMSDWKSSMLGCFGNCGTCCCVSWCYPCAVYRDAEALNKSGLLYGLISCIVPCIPTMLLRSEAREKYGIEGSTAGDAVAAFFALLVFNAKLEMKSRNVEIDPNSRRTKQETKNSVHLYYERLIFLIHTF